jgi:sugar lactone lactonase YvrE
MGMGVSRDGRTIYVAENETGRIQRFDLAPSGQYVYTSTWGHTETDCASSGNFSAPYDIQVDPWGFVYVMDTSCQRVLKFTGNGTYVATVALHVPKYTLAHGLAVDRQGNVYVGAWQQEYTRAADNPAPAPPGPISPLPTPDTTAPVLTSVTVPATTTSQTVTVGVVATDDTAVTDVRVSNEDGVWGNWVPYAATVQQYLSAGYGVKGVTVQVRDAAGNLSNTITKTLTYQAPPGPAPDTVPPVLVSAAVPTPTTAQTVTVTIAATDDTGVTNVRVANEDGVWGAWQPYATTVQQTLTAGYGPKSVTVQVEDAAGNLSNTITQNVVYQAPPGPPPPPIDRTAPVLQSVTMPASTTTQTITLTIAATDDVGVSQVRTANEDGVWSAWQPFASSVQQTLTAGYGIRGVTVQVRDAAGNESNTIYHTLAYAAAPAPGPAPGPVDVADPVLVSATIPNTTTTQAITIALQATDDVGVTRVRAANEDGVWSSWMPYQAQLPWTLSAGYLKKEVYVQVGDASGKESNIMTLKTQLVQNAPAPGPAPGPVDTTAPVLNTLTVPATSTTQNITVTLAATDDVGVAQMRLANEDGVWGPWVAYAPSSTWALSDGYTFKAVFAQVRDAAGNESNILQQRSQWVKDAPVGGVVDTQDPVLKDITIPQPVATTQTISVGITATDDVGVVQVRLANEDGNWGPWQAYSPTVQWTLTSGNLYKAVFVQVRDAAGHESNVIYEETLLQIPA